jgi:ferredoxin
MYTGSFNPLLSRVRVTLLGEQCAIEFGEDCAGCGACADQCFYDALRKETVR